MASRKRKFGPAQTDDTTIQPRSAKIKKLDDEDYVPSDNESDSEIEESPRAKTQPKKIYKEPNKRTVKASPKPPTPAPAESESMKLDETEDKPHPADEKKSEPAATPAHPVPSVFAPLQQTLQQIIRQLAIYLPPQQVQTGLIDANFVEREFKFTEELIQQREQIKNAFRSYINSINLNMFKLVGTLQSVPLFIELKDLDAVEFDWKTKLAEIRAEFSNNRKTNMETMLDLLPCMIRIKHEIDVYRRGDALLREHFKNLLALSEIVRTAHEQTSASSQSTPTASPSIPQPGVLMTQGVNNFFTDSTPNLPEKTPIVRPKSPQLH